MDSVGARPHRVSARKVGVHGVVGLARRRRARRTSSDPDVAAHALRHRGVDRPEHSRHRHLPRAGAGRALHRCEHEDCSSQASGREAPFQRSRVLVPEIIPQKRAKGQRTRSEGSRIPLEAPEPRERPLPPFRTLRKPSRSLILRGERFPTQENAFSSEGKRSPRRSEGHSCEGSRSPKRIGHHSCLGKRSPRRKSPLPLRGTIPHGEKAVFLAGERFPKQNEASGRLARGWDRGLSPAKEHRAAATHSGAEDCLPAAREGVPRGFPP